MYQFKLPLCLLIGVVFLTTISFTQPVGYSFGKQILINDAQVSGTTDFADFVMLVSFTDNDLRTTANAGHVENANGYDIIFTLADCNTLLDHQIEKYDAATGEYLAWVKVPLLLSTANTNIHMYYGNSTVAIDPSTTGVWDANYAAVWHMNQSPALAAPQLIDYTANSNDGVANGGMTFGDLVPGKIGDAIDFDGGNDFFDCGANASTDPTGSITVSAWVNSRAASGHVINRGGGWNDPGYSLFHYNNGIRIEIQRAGEKDIVDNGISINVWHYVALSYDNITGTIRCFIDGAQQGNTGVHTGPIGLPVENLNIARKEQNNFYFNGTIDEGRVIQANRSADWISTEFNNQDAPNTFYTKSGEFSAANLCAVLPIELIEFSVELMNLNDALLTWETASEINNDYFIIEKSIDGYNWSGIGQVDGAGNSSIGIDYSFIDYDLMDFLTYFRLRQIDFDGTSFTSNMVSFKREPTDSFQFYPNPTNGWLSVRGAQDDMLTIFNPQGQIVYQLQLRANESSEAIDLSSLPKGIYLARTSSGFKKIVKN